MLKKILVPALGATVALGATSTTTSAATSTMGPMSTTTGRPMPPAPPGGYGNYTGGMPAGRCPSTDIVSTVTLVHVCAADCNAGDVIESYGQLNGGFLSAQHQQALEQDNDRDNSDFCHGCAMFGSRLQMVDVQIHDVNRRSMDLHLHFRGGRWRCNPGVVGGGGRRRLSALASNVQAAFHHAKKNYHNVLSFVIDGQAPNGGHISEITTTANEVRAPLDEIEAAYVRQYGS